MTKHYQPTEIEAKWQHKWAEDKIYQAIDFDDRPKFVMLTEFPYPSGAGLHIGHTREYTLGDVLARYKRMNGFNVLFPMGYDAFGLPTENYAIKNQISPQTATADNIAIFRRQFDELGLSIDWNRQVNTTDPSYYKWTQWLFLQFLKHGLAYQDDININWCPKCKTGLANEEVVDGKHERCDTPVDKKQLKQWLLRITDYADKLIDGLESVDYPRRIADQQINWIGRSVGAQVKFAVVDSDLAIEIFTTRPDTIFGATFMVLAPEHELVSQVTTEERRAAVEDYIYQAQHKSEVERQETDREKTGVFTGAYAAHPLTGESIPIWVADYVLLGYGTGAIMAVPAHDDRDFAFADKFDLLIKPVIEPPEPTDEIYVGAGKMINSGEFDGLDSEEGKQKITDKLVAEGKAEPKVNYRLRDWIFSRQHYWGEPIPVIHCSECGVVPVPEEDLPVELPPVEAYEPTDTGESPLAAIDDWVNVKCPKCGGAAKRETDTMPNWAGSSWYYLRYFDAHNEQEFAAQDKLKYWGEVDLYLGGMEHTTLHLLYSRFWHQFFHEIGLVPTAEPYAARRGQGIILAEDGTKMSKSKGNIVNPTEIIEAGYGADALRVCIAFLAPYDMTTAWKPDGVPGAYRFLNRVWNLTQEHLESNQETEVSEMLIHKTIKKVSQDLDKMNFNTAIAALMEFTNELYKLKVKGAAGESWRQATEVLLKLTAPFAPHMTEQLWADLGHQQSIHVSDWPVWDEKKLVSELMTIVVQVNGKLRASIEVPTSITEDEIKQIASQQENVLAHTKDKQIIKTIYVPNKLVNIVVN